MDRLIVPRQPFFSTRHEQKFAERERVQIEILCNMSIIDAIMAATLGCC